MKKIQSESRIHQIKNRKEPPVSDNDITGINISILNKSNEKISPNKPLKIKKVKKAKSATPPKKEELKESPPKLADII